MRLLMTAFQAIFLASFAVAGVEGEKTFTDEDIFQLEVVTDPRISPDGDWIVYNRARMDIMTDRRRSELWIVGSDGSGHRPLVDKKNARSARWSPTGDRLIYLSEGQIHLRWMDTGQSTQLTHLTRAPRNMSWSPDGRWIALTMFVPKKNPFSVKLPKKPDGAKWAESPKVIEQLRYRIDGGGYLEEGFNHIFLLPADGGTPRRLTFGNFNHGGAPAWTRDSKALIFSANLRENWQYESNNSEIYRLELETGDITPLTDRNGPDRSPAVSPDGKQIAWLGYEDKYQGYQISKLHIMNPDGSNKRMLTGDLDRSVNSVTWSADGKGLYFDYEDNGVVHLAYIEPKGSTKTLLQDIGGTSLGRPYNGGSFTLSDKSTIAYTRGTEARPADLAYFDGKKTSVLTGINEDLLGHKTLGRVEEIRYQSSFDQQEIQGWIIYPPNFDSARKYPLLLEIHGGPFAMYGPCFSPELQLFASRGYMVLYTNPRGSSGYGERFGNLIHHNYPGQDYDDLISGVDAVIAKGSVDERNLFVTGGSGGGVLTSWIIGKTDRFRAAVVAKPVINWYSFVLTADLGGFFYKYWFPGLPWENLEHYHKRSPISLVGNVKTPTMLLTGEADYRTPISETEQYYQALKLQKVDTVMVRVPDAGHGIARRPSNLIAKVAYISAWFEKYRIE